MSDSGWTVLKFGGTAVKTADRWSTIADILRDRMAGSTVPFVVCSALDGVSDRLEELIQRAVESDLSEPGRQLKRQHSALAEQLAVTDVFDPEGLYAELKRVLRGVSLTGEVTPGLRARIMATGQLLASRLAEAYLRSAGIDVTWLDARQHLQAIDETKAAEASRYGAARCFCQPDIGLQNRLEEDESKVFVTQGVIASNGDGGTVLLGRRGADISATYFAAKLEAEMVELWSDVPGMFTANPHELPTARLLRQLDYAEAQELATMGAEVVHPRALEPARAFSIDVQIRDIERPDMEGTRICSDAQTGPPRVKAVSAKQGVTLVSMETLGMWQQPGFLARAFGCFERHGISIDLVATSETNVTVSLDASTSEVVSDALEAAIAELETFCDVRTVESCGVVSLVGRQIRAILDELGPALDVFDEHRVYLVSQASNDLNLSFVVDQSQADRLVDRLHSTMFRQGQADEVFGRTWSDITRGESTRQRIRAAWWYSARKRLLEIGRTDAPLYVYDAATVEARADQLQRIDSLDSVFYAVKANWSPKLLKRLHHAGVGFECVSPGELEHVFANVPGLEPADVIFTSNFAERKEFEKAFNRGVTVTLDSLAPLEQWPDLFENRELFVRLDPGRGKGHHEYVRTAGSGSKFGIAMAQLEKLERYVERLSLEIVGLHAHIGSGVKTARTWAETAVTLAETADRFGSVETLNVGGGLGVSYQFGDRATDLEALDKYLTEFKASRPEFELWMEPGRFFVAEAGVLVATITQVKRKGEITFVGLNTGMNSLIRPSLYGAHHEIVNLTKLGQRPVEAVEVVGPICETADVLGYDRRLADPEPGDVVLVENAGAYGRVMSSRYNMRAPASERVINAG